LLSEFGIVFIMQACSWNH